MHIAHIVLVKAESHEDAIGAVRANLDDYESRFALWSDWAVVGNEGISNSRWSFEDFGGETWTGADKYAVSRDTERELFDKVVALFVERRQEAFDNLEREITDNGFSFSLDQDNRESYALTKFAKLADSRYCSDSYIYDLANQTANLRYFREEMANDGEEWFAVLVDFHF